MVNQLAKEILKQQEGGATLEDIEWCAKHKGANVTIKGTTYKGVIVGHNEKDYGFYTGGRYPILVELIASDNLLHTFEYGREQVELVE